MQIWGFQQLAFGFSVKENNHKYGLNSKISPEVFFNYLGDTKVNGRK